jgi:hypothetical protein
VANNCRGEVWRGNLDALLNEGVLRDVLARYARRFRFTPTERAFVYKSAVYRSADTSVWEPLLAIDDCRAIVHMFLSHDSPQARIAGTKAAATLADPDGALGNVCVNLALHDPEEPVRRAAGWSLGVLATPTHLGAIRAALRVNRTRRAATEAMGDLHRAGRDLSGFSVYRRCRARAIARAALRRQHAEEIRLRARAGAIAGLVAAAVWLFAVAIPMTIVAGWVGGFGLLQSPELLLAAFWLIGIIPAGSLFGWRIGRAGAVQAAYDGREGRWFRALMRVTVLYLLSMSAIVVIFGGVTIQLGWVIPLAMLASSLAYMLCVAGLVLLVQPQILACRTMTRMGAATLLFSFQVACLPLALLLGALAKFPEGFGDVEVPTFLVGLWLSVGVAVSTITLAATAPKKFKVEATPPRRTRLLTLARHVILLATVAGFFLVYRFDSLPFSFFGRRLAVAPGTAVDFETNLRVGLADSSYLHLASAEGPRWLRATNIPPNVEVLFDDERVFPWMLVHVPAGAHVITLRGRIEQPSSERVAIRMLPDALGNGETKGLIAVVATRQPHTNMWVGSLHGTVGQTGATRVQLSSFDAAGGVGGDGTADLVVNGRAARSGGSGTTGATRVILRLGTEVLREVGAEYSDVASVDVSPAGTWSASFVLTLTPGAARTAPDQLSTVFRVQMLTD